MIYYISFILSALLIHFGTKSKNEKVCIIYFVIAVLIPSVLAGCRDYVIGTDVQMYGLMVFNTAKASSHGLVPFLLLSPVEVGFSALAYLCSRIFSNAHGFFFILGIINYGLIAKFIYDNKDRIVPGIAWLVFTCTYFGESFNTMRQSCAVAITLYGYKFIRDRKWFHYAICVGIAMLFHQTAIIAITLYFIYDFMKTRNKWFNYVVIISAVLVAVLSYSKILEFVVNTGLFTQRYSHYFVESAIGIRISSSIIRIIPMAIIMLFWPEFKKKNKDDTHYILMMLILDLILFNMVTMSEVLARVGMYMGIYRVYAYSSLCSSVSLKNNRRFVYMFMIAYLFLLFTNQIVIHHGGEIYPYTSEILGIR